MQVFKLSRRKQTRNSEQFIESGDDDDHVVEVPPPTPPRGSASAVRQPATPHPGKEDSDRVKKGREAILRLKD